MKYATQCFWQIVKMPPAISRSITSTVHLNALMRTCLTASVQNFMENQAGNKPPVFILRGNTAMIRAYQFHIELIPPTESVPRTICKNIVRRSRVANDEGVARFERLCFLKIIPELSLLVVASQAGRAALMTLTKPSVYSGNGPVVNFRLDLVLPHKGEDEDGHRRVAAPLYGMAIAPVQTTPEKHKRLGPRRWRLVMQYYDSTILSYEISRDDETSDLLVL